MRTFIVLAVVSVGVLSGIALWRGGDRQIEALEARVSAPAKVPTPPQPVTMENPTPSAVRPPPVAERMPAEIPTDARRDHELKTLNRLRAEAADAVKSTEEM